MIEIRRVPADWQHPRDDEGRYIPMFGSFEVERRKWLAHGKQGPAPVRGDGPHPPRGACSPFSEAEATHYQVYEDVSEGTPLSPVFARPNDIVGWLKLLGQSEGNARAFLKLGAVPSLTNVDGRYVEGLAASTHRLRRAASSGPDESKQGD